MVIPRVASVMGVPPKVIDFTIDTDKEEILTGCSRSVPDLKDVGSQLVEIMEGCSVGKQHCVCFQGCFNHPVP